MKYITKIAIACALAGALFPLLAAAQTTGLNATATVTLSASAKSAQAKADKEIDRRVASLNDLVTRVQLMSRVSDTLKQGLTSNVQNQIQALNTLKAKIDADTDLPTLKTDVQSVTQSYRIYALIIPQGRISAAADRVVNITAMMQGLGIKLQTRLQSAASAGASTTVDATLLNDVAAKISDAQAQAQSAITVIVPLAPDNGDKTVMAANTKALLQAQTYLTTAQKDLVQARKDIGTIEKSLSTLIPSTTTSATASTSVTGR